MARNLNCKDEMCANQHPKPKLAGWTDWPDKRPITSKEAQDQYHRMMSGTKNATPAPAPKKSSFATGLKKTTAD